MINITLPSIAVQKVENGYVIEWTRLIPEAERKGSERTKRVNAIAATDYELLSLIQRAAEDVAQIE